MKKETNKPPQLSLILRVLCAGYLIYTAWDLREAFQEGPQFIIFALIFVVIGLVLGAHSIYKLVKGEYTLAAAPAAAAEDEESKDCEEQSDE